MSYSRTDTYFRLHILIYIQFLSRRRQWQPTPVLLLGNSHGWRSLVGCSLWGREESDTTERLPFHFSLSCVGEGNDNPLQRSCLENPRERGAWWAAVYGVTQSRTRLKWLSSSSSSCLEAKIYLSDNYCHFLPGEWLHGYGHNLFGTGAIEPWDKALQFHDPPSFLGSQYNFTCKRRDNA